MGGGLSADARGSCGIDANPGTRAVLTIAATLCVLLLCAPSANADWQRLDSRFNASSATSPPAAVGVGGAPWVAWTGGPEGGSTGARQVHVKRWTGSAWELVGGPLNANPDSVAELPAIANIGGVAHVAWFESDDGSGAERVRVSRWDQSSSAWVPVGTSLLDVGATVAGPEVDIAEVGGEPYVAWSQRPGGVGAAEVHVKRFTADAWQAVGGALNFDPARDATKAAITPVGGEPHVAFSQVEDSGGTERVRVAKFAASSWSAVGGALGVTPPGGTPQIDAISGAPAVLWFEQGLGGPPLRLSRWNGTAWIEPGGVIASTAPVSVPALTVVDDTPYVAWVRTHDTHFVSTAYLDGSTWVDAGELPRDGGTFGIADPSLANVGGVPHLSWADYDGTATRLYGARYIPAASVQFSSDQYDVDESDGTAEVIVERHGNPTEPASVDYTIADGTATDPEDFVGAGAGTVDFDSGETQEALVISIEDEGLPEDDETVEFSLSNAVGATLGDPAAATMTIHDDDEIDTEIFGGPSGPTNSSTASFAFTATPSAGATFECSLDGAMFAPCPVAVTLSNLSQGPHQFRVRAKNATATDTTPATRSFFVDTVAPTTTISLTPGGSQLPGQDRYAGRVIAGASASDPTPASGIAVTRCVLDPPAVPTQFIELPNTFGLTCAASTEAPGVHTVYAASQDLAGNVEPVVIKRTFTIVPFPDTTITSGPSGMSSVVARFAFTSTIPGSRFECRVDGGAYGSCSSTSTLYGLALGPHTFSVRAITPDGVTDPSPAVRNFTLAERTVTAQPCTRLVPWDDPKKTERCNVIREVCPTGSVCTVTGKVDGTQKDTGVASFSPWVEIGQEHVAGLGRVTGFYACATNFGPASGRCPSETTLSYIGAGQPLVASCWVDSSLRLNNAVRGPDDARKMICTGSFTAKPGAPLDAVSAAGTTVKILVPGPGTVGIGPGGSGRPRARSTLERKQKPAFKPITRTVAGEGVEDFKLKLSAKAKKKLKKKGKLGLSIAATFTPEGGGEVVAKTSQVTLTRPGRRP